MPTRASDSSKFTRWDEDSLRGGILTHPGIVENGVITIAVPRTNRRGAASKREADFGSDGRGFESLRARHSLASILAHVRFPPPRNPSNRLGCESDSRCGRRQSQVPAI